MSYFSEEGVAERYARARPYIHRKALGKFRAFADVADPFRRALDVACGTGQSTVALAELAERVIGIDASDEMLAHATPHPRVEYRVAVAEELPFGSDHFDLVTVAQALHWLETCQFRAEACRVLKASGWLVIYTSWFTEEMRGEPAFAEWFDGVYLDRYPSPPRGPTNVTPEFAETFGLRLLGEDEFANEIAMSRGRFTDYQLSTSNIIAAVRRKGESFEEAEEWIRDSLEPFFPDDERRTFLFAGKIWYLQKPGRQ